MSERKMQTVNEENYAQERSNFTVATGILCLVFSFSLLCRKVKKISCSADAILKCSFGIYRNIYRKKCYADMFGVSLKLFHFGISD